MQIFMNISFGCQIICSIPYIPTLLNFVDKTNILKKTTEKLLSSCEKTFASNKW